MRLRIILLVLSLTFISSIIDAQTVLFSCDFEQGIPDTFKMYDVDGFEPSRGMKSNGFATGIAWLPFTEDAETENANGTAYSGSWYKEANRSNDWLITPAITVTNAQAILSWRAHAIDADNADGYSVYISDRGNSPEDFTSEPVYKVAAENAEWTEHHIALEKWAGKKIYVAFVNDSYNCNLLAIDDIKAFYYDHTFVYTSTNVESLSSPGEVAIKGSITPSGFIPLSGFVAKLKYKGEETIVDFSTTSILVGSIFNFDFGKSISVAQDATENYEIEISSGDDVLTQTMSITCFKRNVIIEEGTGTWCVYCPRGQLGLHLLKEKYPDLIDVAVHISDKLTISSYASNILSFFAQGIPHCVMDRNINYIGDPYYDVEERYLNAKNEGALGRIKVSAVLDNAKNINISTTTEFGKAIDNDMYRLAFIVVEDSVTGYPQSNAFSGAIESWGGLNLLPDPIPAGEYYFANVARAIYPSYNGDSEIFAAPVAQRIEIKKESTYPLPANITDIAKVKIIASIINTTTGRIENSAMCKLDNQSGVSAISANENGVIICKTADQSISISTASSEDIDTVYIYSVDGRCLLQATPHSNIYNTTLADISGSPIYLVKVCTHSGVYTKKIAR